MEDIAPALLNDLQQAFAEKLDASDGIRRLLKAIRDGTGTYIEAGDYAWEVGDALANVFGERLSSAVLPDGRMYYNIADRVIRPLLEQDYALVAEAARTVQQHLNEKAELGLKAQAAPLNVDRIDGIIDRVSAAESFDDVRWLLGDPVRTFSQSIVDATLKANMDFQGKAGLSPKIHRKATGKCCEWCQQLAGTYRYPDTPDDVYRRHNNCRCTVEYDGGDAKNFRNVWTKKWTTAEERDRIENRKSITSVTSGRHSPIDIISRSAGQVGATDGDTVITAAEPFDFTNKTAINTAISIFLEQHSSSPVEHAIVISPDGHLYRLTGTNFNVNTALIGEDALIGSIGAHNHPVWPAFDQGDSFSRADVIFTVHYKTGKEYLSTGNKRYSFEYTGSLSADEIAEAYDTAIYQAREQAFASNTILEYEQEAAMRILANSLEGFVFNENV